jgi:peptide/nickel transport system ATP-binding protein
MNLRSDLRAPTMSTNQQTASHDVAVSLRVSGLSKRYVFRKKLWSKPIQITAANDITFELSTGKTLALVGSSGSGKSTVARCVTRLERPDTGEIWLAGADVAPLHSRDLRPFRTQIQMIFQDPVTAMNPRMSAAQIIEEPLLIQNRGSRDERRSRAAELIKEVGLAADWLDRQITEFSGGQRQRIAIARALILEPKVLILDEALTGLDLSTQAQVIDLLLTLQATRSLSYLLISHDLALAARVADHVAVMSAGQIVEQGATREIISKPKQPETQALVAAAERFRVALAKAHGASA